MPIIKLGYIVYILNILSSHLLLNLKRA